LKAKKAKPIKLDSICFDGHVFTKLRIKKDEQDQLINYTVTVSYRQDNTEEQSDNNQHRNKEQNNGPAPSPIYVKGRSQRLHCSYRGKNFNISLPSLVNKENVPKP
jgi:hypothetical protein